MNGAARRGFTLIEMLVVIAIIAVLAAILFPAISLALNKRNAHRTSVMIDSLKTAIEAYLKDETCLGAPLEKLENGDLLAPIVTLNQGLIPRGFTLEVGDSNALKDSSGTLAGPFVPCRAKDATHLKDGWGGPILVQVVEEPLPGLANRTQVASVLLRSQAGYFDTDHMDLQILRRFDVRSSAWRDATLLGKETNGRWKYQDK